MTETVVSVGYRASVTTAPSPPPPTAAPPPPPPPPTSARRDELLELANAQVLERGLGRLSLWVESYGRSLVEPDGPWGRFAPKTVED